MRRGTPAPTIDRKLEESAKHLTGELRLPLPTGYHRRRSHIVQAQADGTEAEEKETLSNIELQHEEGAKIVNEEVRRVKLCKTYRSEQSKDGGISTKTKRGLDEMQSTNDAENGTAASGSYEEWNSAGSTRGRAGTDGPRRLEEVVCRQRRAIDANKKKKGLLQHVRGRGSDG